MEKIDRKAAEVRAWIILDTKARVDSEFDKQGGVDLDGISGDAYRVYASFVLKDAPAVAKAYLDLLAEHRASIEVMHKP